jgi:hypothetical protein
MVYIEYLKKKVHHTFSTLAIAIYVSTAVLEDLEDDE